ncbi:MAG: PEP-CTERM sorting domain-containing protein [Planctomycetales bacterium]|nr:PEP-CTERM sorting domain-containing protein [Planctomycetales bacterium]
MNFKKWFAVAAVAYLTATTSGTALAVPTIDGNASGDGYASLSTQNTNTHFGDASTGDAINGGGGSEIDQVFAKIEGGRLYMVIAGNLQSNFNKLDIYFDSDSNAAVPGGVNQVVAANLPAGVDPYSGGAFEGSNGLIFDAGFTADYFMTFNHGFEKLREGLPSELQFYASTAHYADMTQGTSGAVIAPGMQLAQRGLPQVLRGTTADFDTDGDVDGGEFLTWQRNFGTTSGANRSDGNADGGDDNGTPRDVDGDDFNIWASTFGFNVANASLSDFPFAPQSADEDNSEALLGPTLNGGLPQGFVIDKNYALGAGGCTDNSGTGCLPKEVEFALEIDTINDPGNTYKHRNMDNSALQLEMAWDNSNIAGVDNGDEHAGDFTTPTTFNTSAVTTGIEFSIPLSMIGSPSAGDTIKITAFINGDKHSYASNQFAGDGVLLGNLGGDGSGAFTGDLTGLDLGLIPGNQFVSIVVPGPLSGSAAVPEPGSLALVGLGAMACGLVRRRRIR